MTPRQLPRSFLNRNPWSGLSQSSANPFLLPYLMPEWWWFLHAPRAGRNGTEGILWSRSEGKQRGVGGRKLRCALGWRRKGKINSHVWRGKGASQSMQDADYKGGKAPEVWGGNAPEVWGRGTAEGLKATNERSLDHETESVEANTKFPSISVFSRFKDSEQEVYGLADTRGFLHNTYSLGVFLPPLQHPPTHKAHRHTHLGSFLVVDHQTNNKRSQHIAHYARKKASHLGMLRCAFEGAQVDASIQLNWRSAGLSWRQMRKVCTMNTHISIDQNL